MGHYPEKASPLDFKDTDIPRFGDSDVVFDLFIGTRFLHSIALISNLYTVDPFTKHCKLVHNGGFLKSEVLYFSQNTIKSIKIQ